MEQKVSVVVPIYNVEKYLNRCIDSIVNQSYKNLQIILVDDGSPDYCGKIADEYAAKDNRIEVIHKSNGGLSDARNFGVKKINGDFTLFVDSDDWMEVNMIETMVNNINKYNADIVQAAFYYAYEDHLLYDDRYYSERSKPALLSNNELMRELVINERVKNFAWGKLYKASLVKDIPFKKGVLFEDVFWAHQVMIKVNKYVIIHEPLCYYLQRSDSIVSNYSVKNLDIIKGLKERHKFIEKNYKEYTNYSYKIILKTSLMHYNLLMINKEKDKDKLFRKEIKKYIYDNYRLLLNSIDKEDKDMRDQLILFKLYPPLNILIILKNKMFRKLKIYKEEKHLKRISINTLAK